MGGLENNNLYIAAVDIDGTIKDLVKENTNALINSMKNMDNIYLTKRGRFVLWINKINMCFIKSGILPTNSFMQKTLLFLYSKLLFKKYSTFKRLYFQEYNKQNIFFDCADDMIKRLNDLKLLVYLVTKNHQNKRMLKLKNNYIVKSITNIVIGRKRVSKYFVYKSFLSNKLMSKENVLIVGDNFWDDVLPGLILGATVVWSNMYKSKLKKVAIKFLKLFFINLKDDKELFATNKT